MDKTSLQQQTVGLQPQHHQYLHRRLYERIRSADRPILKQTPVQIQSKLMAYQT